MKRKIDSFLLKGHPSSSSRVVDEEDIPLGEIVKIASRSSAAPPKEKEEEEDSLSPTSSEEEEDMEKSPHPPPRKTIAHSKHRRPQSAPPVTAEEITRELWKSLGQDPDDIFVMEDGKFFKCKRCHSAKSKRMPLKGTYHAMYHHCRTATHIGAVGQRTRQCGDEEEEEEYDNKEEEEDSIAVRMKQSRKYARWPLARMEADARKYWVDTFDQLPSHYELQCEGTFLKCLICEGVRHGCWNNSGCIRAHVRTQIHRDALARLIKSPDLDASMANDVRKALAKAVELRDARNALSRSRKQKRQEWEQPEPLLEPREKYTGSYGDDDDDDDEEEEAPSVVDKEQEEEMHMMVPDDKQRVENNKRPREHDEKKLSFKFAVPPAVPLAEPPAASPVIIDAKPKDDDDGDALERRHRSHVLKRIKVDADFRARVLKTMELKPEFHAKIMKMKDDEFEAELLSMDDGDTTGIHAAAPKN